MGSVAFYIGSLKKGGAERVFVNLATYFLEQGCNVTMVTQYKKENEYELPAGIRRVISDLTPEEEGGRIVNLFRRYKSCAGSSEKSMRMSCCLRLAKIILWHFGECFFADEGCGFRCGGAYGGVIRRRGGACLQKHCFTRQTES